MVYIWLIFSLPYVVALFSSFGNAIMVFYNLNFVYVSNVFVFKERQDKSVQFITSTFLKLPNSSYFFQSAVFFFPVIFIALTL